MSFTGGSFNSIDEKGRLVIPAKFREELGEKFMLVKGFDKCVSIYTNEQFNRILERLNEMPTSDATTRRPVRHIVGFAEECECDKLGRIIIDQPLREYANLQRDVFVTGLVNRVEIWDREEYAKYERESEDADNSEKVSLEEALKTLKI